MQYYFGVVATDPDMDEGIVEKGMVNEENVGVETVEEISYGKTGFLDGSSSTQETKNSVGLVAMSKSSRS